MADMKMLWVAGFGMTVTSTDLTETTLAGSGSRHVA